MADKTVYVYVAIRTDDRGCLIGINGVFTTKAEGDSNSSSAFCGESSIKMKLGGDMADLLKRLK